MGSESLKQTLPYGEGAFHTDDNGAIILHLGKSVYTGIYKETEPYYWVFVNGQNKSQTVTSTETGLIQPPLRIGID
jgi:hypothetical protein